MTIPPGTVRPEKLREIENILHFRSDLSPFLVHLTRDTLPFSFARDNLLSILDSKSLRYGNEAFSSAIWGLPYEERTEKIKFEFFNAISFTETPLSEIHNLLCIEGRQKQFSNYGLVLFKANLRKKGVSPTIYINNENDDKEHLIQALCSLINSPYEESAKQILPLIAVFGKYVRTPDGFSREDPVDFTWEREWRFASGTGKFDFSQDDVFLGLCPDIEIDVFEKKHPWLTFIDPMRNAKWYAEKLVARRKKFELEHSVV